MPDAATWPNFQRQWRELEMELPAPPFILIDAAGVQTGARGLPRGACADFESLFHGDLADELSEVGPYLGQAAGWDEAVPRTLWPLLHQRIAMLLWPADAAIDFSTLRRHLRKFNLAYDSTGRPHYFRFCDPRVLLKLLQDAAPVTDCQPLLQPLAGMLIVDGGDELRRVFLQDGRALRLA